MRILALLLNRASIFFVVDLLLGPIPAYRRSKLLPSTRLLAAIITANLAGPSPMRTVSVKRNYFSDMFRIP
jgi:hypothetical protein